uniref:COP9 signalosome complex subunit 8 n=1 Tax=Percolomonas cosmopolitus TaxID=63605 RepID=A0A7S1KSI2_9EUKA|mmetsp:Transcript_7440/g.27848  ORF Transcript_7440/g.27848 Transcript_7440/m.27848 type:complete len:170 (+) Transcript_7440:693-1202(+)|eukprot:CAMPEP_0117438502 /NCGR_PEP_ID=MMETSP0759-20121206/2086_1 /TAXON_ID=63605 /ORGANISM="Percolomonas cosmopolitus, Strain WS" /LENGTH=169 /DNA_ID=CAMNT_0005230195 /DNA_START=494 /DNA_END=1003 /DNA_ORIENTATION=+
MAHTPLALLSRSIHRADFVNGSDLTQSRNNARFLWKRLDGGTQNALRPVWQICVHMWKREYGLVYKVIKNPQTPWPQDLMPVIHDVMQFYRTKMLQLVQRAYDNIDVKTISEYLALSEKELDQFAQGQGWKIEDGLVYPTRGTLKEPSQAESFKLLRELTDRTLFLELD